MALLLICIGTYLLLLSRFMGSKGPAN